MLTQVTKLKSALEELSNRGYDVHCDAVMVKDVNEDLMKELQYLYQSLQQTVLNQNIPIIEAEPILFCIPAIGVPVFDNIKTSCETNMV